MVLPFIVITMGTLAGYQKMTKITDKNREGLIDSYIDQTLDSMDLNSVLQLAREYLENNLKEYSNEQLEKEIEEYYPDLLEN